jgi:hypothetical protein
VRGQSASQAGTPDRDVKRVVHRFIRKWRRTPPSMSALVLG